MATDHYGSLDVSDLRRVRLAAFADISDFSTNEKLRALSFWQRGGSDHARSATRHLCLYLARAGLVSAQQLRG